MEIWTALSKAVRQYVGVKSTLWRYTNSSASASQGVAGDIMHSTICDCSL
jgi:hypothetical protein